MARLTQIFCLLVFGLGVQHLTAFQSGGDSLAQLESRLAVYMQHPAPESPIWRRKIAAILPRLEHSTSRLVYDAWRVLADSAVDSDISNLLLYSRRHDCAMPKLDTDSLRGPEVTLERALASWGSGDQAATSAILLHGLTQFPDDDRFLQNLNWLELSRCTRYSVRGDSRLSALSVLAARRAFR